MSAPGRPTSVVLAGGGTGGHIEPMLALADALRGRAGGGAPIRITCLGTARGMETRLVPARGYDLRLIPPVPLPRKPTPDLLRVPARVWRSVAETRALLDELAADVVVGFGGYVALPAYLAARRAGIPIVVHEQNALPGLANRIGARLAARVAATVPGTPLHRAEHVGMPLRRAISSLDRAAARAGARAEFGLDADRPTLLVVGGSQGAASLNRAAVGAADALTAAGIQVLHARGPKNTDVAVPPRPAGQRALRGRGLSGAHGPRLRRRRPRPVPGRRGDRGRTVGRGAARGLRPAPDRQRRAAAQRAPDGRRRRRIPGRGRRPEPGLDRARRCCRCSPTRPRWPGTRATRRPPASPTPTRSWPTSCCRWRR